MLTDSRLYNNIGRQNDGAICKITVSEAELPSKKEKNNFVQVISNIFSMLYHDVF